MAPGLPTHARKASDEGAHAGGPLRTVLLIEEAPGVGFGLGGELRGLGYELLDTVSSCEEALLVASRCRPDLVVMDIPAKDDDRATVGASMLRESLRIPVLVLGAPLRPALSRELGSALDRALRSDAPAAQLGEVRVAPSPGDEVFISDAQGHLQRLAALGTVAASVGHEINNPLSALANNLDFLRALNGSAEVEQVVVEMREAVQRIHEIVRALGGVKRPGQGKVRGNVEAAVDWALSSTARELLLRARITRDMAPVPNVTLSETRLGQVLVNLLLNAAHAIDPGRVGENEVRLRVYSPEPGRVVLQVSDTGHGVPAAMLPRLFEPFFTTKPVGRGTGLGLSVCKSIVEAAGGGIEVESKEGVGTTFSLSLPVARETTIPAPAAKVEAVARRLALLVVDDEPLITRSLVRLLSPRHDVQAVHDVDAALRVLSSGAAIDAILCDLVMPDRTGIELYAELRTRGSELSERIVFLTGGGLTPALSSFLRGFPSRILHKPCEPSEIEVMLERVCARPEG